MSERKVALITGASGGIGSAAALEFAQRGFSLALTDVDPNALAAIAEQARAAGASVEAIPADLTDISLVESLPQRFIERLRRIDVLVNNAAWRDLHTMRQITLESWDKTLRICLTAPAFLARVVAKQMEPQKSGVIINVSSIMSARANGISPAYVAAKGGLDALTFDLAALLGPSGIRVVAINPGAVDTAMSADYDTADQVDLAKRLRAWSEEMIPLRRWARPQEIARAIALLASDEASYLSGTTITLDGGWSRQLWPYGLKHAQNPEEFP